MITRNNLRNNLPYLTEDKDRHGNHRIFVRRYGRKIRIRQTPGTEEYSVAYADALRRISELGGSPDEGKQRPRSRLPETLGWLALKYFSSRKFKKLHGNSQTNRRRIIETCLDERQSARSKKKMKECATADISAQHIIFIRDRRVDAPGAANNRLKYLSAMFGWAIETTHMSANPVRDVRPITYASDGFYTWTSEDIRKFEDRHPVGTKARLALALLLFLGVRRGDVVRLGKGNISDGWIKFVPAKTNYARATPTEKPILPTLAAVIAASNIGDRTFLVTDQQRPYTPAGFCQWFKRRCREADLPQCSPHGLRKAAAAMTAEAGASDRQLMALFDWSSSAQANTYTKRADRKRLAGDAARLLDSVWTASNLD